MVLPVEFILQLINGRNYFQDLIAKIRLRQCWISSINPVIQSAGINEYLDGEIYYIVKNTKTRAQGTNLLV